MSVERLPFSPNTDSTKIDNETESPVNTAAGLACSAGPAAAESGNSRIESSIEPPLPGGAPARVREGQVQAGLLQNILMAHLSAADPDETELPGAAVSGSSAPLLEADASEQLSRVSALLTDLSTQSAAALEAGGGVKTYLEKKLASMGDDAHLAKIDLQEALQKQQQLIQMLSNMSMLLANTALSVIRKIG